jgi:site-specific recombinase XerD
MQPVFYNDQVLKLPDWPAPDRQLWLAGLQPGDILEGETYAAGLRPTTLRNSARGYGRWLGVLAHLDPPALLLPPADRVTPARMRLFLKALRRQGNTNNTIKARCWEMRSALRIMLPGRDFHWLNKPAERSLEVLLPTVRKPIRLMSVAELTTWGHDLMRDGLAARPDRSTEEFRNGLLIAILADRAPRLRSLASLRLGRGIQRHGFCYRLTFRIKDTKGHGFLEYDLHPTLTPKIEHYLAVERPRLLGGKDHDWFWVNRDGDRLDEVGITAVIWRGSQARFGFAFGTHRFRSALATAGIVASRATAAIVATVLGNAPAVTERYYVIGGQVEAARSLQDTLAAIRAGTQDASPSE